MAVAFVIICDVETPTWSEGIDSSKIILVKSKPPSHESFPGLAVNTGGMLGRPVRKAEKKDTNNILLLVGLRSRNSTTIYDARLMLRHSLDKSCVKSKAGWANKDCEACAVKMTTRETVINHFLSEE
ncbi:hypothetical protein PMAYCL1PPCAC_14538, partial [Pristionchus mayeri]